MEKDAKIFVAGHNGMVGSAICRALEAGGFSHILLKDGRRNSI
jgi:GDP-L-fucose synthase